MRGDRLFWLVIALIAGAILILVANHDAGSSFGLANEEFGRLVHAGAIGVVIAAGLLASGRLSDTARGIAVWAVVILGLAVGYQYRYELQDIASGVTMGLVPGSPMSLSFSDGTGVRIDRLSSGHFEVVGSVDGAEIRFVVDTGATTTVLTADDARHAGFDTARLAFNIPVSTANGMAQAARVVAEELAIGTITRRRVPMLVTEPGQLDQSLLGMNFIGTLSGFEMRGDRMILKD